MRGRRLLRTDFASIIGFGLVTQMLNVISGPLVARMLGPRGRGELVFVLIVAFLVSHLMIAALVKAISAVVARRGHGGRAVLGHYLWWWRAWCLAPATVAALWVFAALDNSEQRTSLAVLTFVTTLAGSILTVLSAIALGEHKVKLVSITGVVFTGAYVIAVAVLFATVGTSSPATILFCTIAGQALAIVLVTRALAPGTSEHVQPDVRREVHRFTRYAYVSTLGTSDRLGIDSLLMGYVLGTVALGLFSVALSVGSLPSVLLAAMASALLPRMTARDAVEAAAVLRKWVMAGVLVAVGIVAVLQLILDPAIRIFFGEAFIPSIAVARVLLIAQTLIGIRLMLSVAVQAQGRAGAASYVDLCCGAILVVAVLVGAHTHGLMGGALGMTFAAACNCTALATLTSWSGRGVRSSLLPDR